MQTLRITLDERFLTKYGRYRTSIKLEDDTMAKPIIGRCFSLLLLLLVTIPITVAAGPDVSGKYDFGGWAGIVTFTQAGNRVTGTYSGGQGNLTGTLSGDTLTGTYTWREGGKTMTGEIKLRFSADRTRVDGTWRRTTAGKTSSGTWGGPRIGAPPPGKVSDLTGSWRDENGIIYCMRQVGNELFWKMDDRPRVQNVFHGTISGNKITGKWADVPGGRIMNSGNLVLRIESGNRIVKAGQSSDYFGSVWTRSNSRDCF
jgi:hypothetical protein